MALAAIITTSFRDERRASWCSAVFGRKIFSVGVVVMLHVMSVATCLRFDSFY